MDKLIQNTAAQLHNKQVIANYIADEFGDEKMLKKVGEEKAQFVFEVCKNDPVIRSRFNYLLQQH
ncbi:hypothetical protein QSI79_08300 [Enterobacter asburiae]|uniref:hypothetical protein n=1 Tax=Enterobacter asburiae TaxID=61645 RepID=UPI002879BA39|nr:hypothetical protein [Enterobacter asburiae]MDS1913299.1 hypothetical protein [Enterobacter asburiae]